MGTVVSIDIPDADKGVFEECFHIFHSIDKIFSTYKATSEVSMYNNGKLSLDEATASFTKVFDACTEYKKLTNGFFDAYYGNRYDPSGYVKGYAIDQVGKMLTQKGYSTYLINAGGDILAQANEPEFWNIAISDPSDTGKIVANMKLDSAAIATSGTYERGNHIMSPTGESASFFKSVSIIGPSIIEADVYATAVYAMGEKGLDFMKTIPNYSCLYVDHKNKASLIESSK